MPLYATRCIDCGDEDQIYRTVAARDEAIPACECGGTVQRVVSAPYVAPDMSPYRSMVTGELITSRSHHRQHLKDHGCIEVGNEMKYLQGKQKPEISKESKEARKRTIIDQVNALK